MLAQYMAVKRFMEASHAALGETDQLAALRRMQKDNLTAMFRSHGRADMADCAALLSELQSDTVAFARPQQQELAAVVVTLGGGATIAQGPQEQGHAKTQKHQFLYNYMPQALWDKITNVDRTEDIMIDAMSSALVEVGCVNPAEPTYVHACAIAASVDPNMWSKQKADDFLQKLKRAVITKRSSVHCRPRTMHEFPEAVADFIRIYPTYFGEGSQPVPSPIDRRVIADRQSQIKARRSATGLNAATNSGQAASSNNAVGSVMQALQLFQTMFSGGGATPNITYCDRPQLRRAGTFLDDAPHGETPPPKRHRMIADGQAYAHHAQLQSLASVGDASSPDIAGLRYVERPEPRSDIASPTVYATSSGASATLVMTGAKAPLPLDDIEAEINAALDEKKVIAAEKRKDAKLAAAESGEEPVKSKAKGKGKSKAKGKAKGKGKGKGAAKDTSTAKPGPKGKAKLAKESDIDRPGGKAPPLPSVKKAMEPIDFNGCKIYLSLASKKWRVVPEPGVSRYDKQFVHGSSPAAAWKQLVAYCLDPILPDGHC
jgi:hypothetical protein